jgi:hypothetical protein
MTLKEFHKTFNKIFSPKLWCKSFNYKNLILVFNKWLWLKPLQSTKIICDSSLKGALKISSLNCRIVCFSLSRRSIMDNKKLHLHWFCYVFVLFLLWTRSENNICLLLPVLYFMFIDDEYDLCLFSSFDSWVQINF